MADSHIPNAVAHALRIKGRGTARALADALGLEVEPVEGALTDLGTRGWAADTSVPALGWRMTPAGRDAVQSSVDALPVAVREQVAGRYRAFQRLDLEFKRLCADWQQRDAGTMSRERIAARLREIDTEVRELLGNVPATHLGTYARRFSIAMEKFQTGSDEFLTGVRVDSYHNIWFECHEDFLLLLGRSRVEDERHAGHQ